MSLTNAKLPSVCLLAAAETSPSVLFGLYDVMSTAGAIYTEMTTGEEGELVLDVKIVAASDQPFRCYGDVLVEPHASIDQVDDSDVVIVCDMYTRCDTPPRGRYEPEMAWLRRMYAKGSIIGSVCSGSLVLAEAGLLDGQEASSHWAYRQLFSEHYPSVTLRVGSLVTLSGEHDRIVTCGAVTSWQELAVYLIGRLCGSEHAIKTAKVHLLSDHQDGQLPFAVMTPRVQQADAVIGDCQAWIAENYATSNPVARMTERAGLTTRTFARRFRAATGFHPMDYVHEIRVEQAKQLLESDSVSVEEVGQRVGYEDPTSFRRLFKRKAGLSPAAYRRKFVKLLDAGVH